MLRLWVKDNVTGIIHEYGTDEHDALVLREDGSLHYLNMQNGVGTLFPDEGYSFCRKDGTIPNTAMLLSDDVYIDIGGEGKIVAVVKKAANVLAREKTFRDKPRGWIVPKLGPTYRIDAPYFKCPYCSAIEDNTSPYCPQCGKRILFED